MITAICIGAWRRGPLRTVRAAAVCIAFAAVGRADDLVLEEEAAIRAAVSRVAAATVRIEPAGVSEAALGAGAEANPARGPSTGIVVAPGRVLTTSFAVPKDVAEAIVMTPSVEGRAAAAAGGGRGVARVIGRDLARGLVLLRMDDESVQPVAEWVPRAELAVGQWSIAVGRGWEAAEPSVAVGVISAVNRSWGRSVQTDASVSPANYGGPLVDIAGRVIGILAPLPADTAGMNLGTELYDSGIGFAVPLEDMMRVLPRLERGESLAPGVMGIGYASRDPFTGAATIATCRAGSPAARAGLRPGDTIVSADGRPVSRIAELRHLLATRYAGDTIELVVTRSVPKAAAGGDRADPVRITVRVELAKELPPWRRPMLGIVPERSAARDGQRTPVRIAWVWPGGPAARAGLVTGDVIEAAVPPAVEGEGTAGEVAVDSPAALAGVVAGTEPGAAIGLVVSRGDRRQTMSVESVTMPADLPADFAATVPEYVPKLPMAVPPGAGPGGDRGGDVVKVERLEAPEVAKPPVVVLPGGSAREPVGVLVYLDAPRGDVDEQQAAAWKLVAARHGVAVILPGSTDPQRWGREDIGGIKRALATLAAKRAVDPARIAVAGQGAGGSFAWLVAESLGPVVRGVAIVDASLPRQASIEPVEPGRSRWVLFGTTSGQATARVEDDRRRLEQAGFTAGTMAVEQGGAVAVAPLLAAWVEALGTL
jgi:serine protease Do